MFQFDDLTLALISLHVLLVQTIMRTITPSLTVFNISLIFSQLSSVSSAGMRAYLSKLVEPDEIGRVFTIQSTIDASIPLLSSVVFSNLFAATIDSMPNLSFSAVALGLQVSIICIFVVALKDRRRQTDGEVANPIR